MKVATIKGIIMQRLILLVVLTGILVAPRSVSAGGDDYYQSASAATRELSTQLDFLQRSLTSIPGRGFYQQFDGMYPDLVYFQQQLKRKVPPEMLLVAFEKVDSKLHQLMSDLKNFEKWNPALAMVANRVQSADHDLHFALLGGNGGGGDAQSQSLRRQTLVLLARWETLDNMVRYAFVEQDSFTGWTSDLAAFKQGIVLFQLMQNNGAGPPDLKAQFVQVDLLWSKVVNRVKALPQGQWTLVQSDAAQVDQVLVRLAALVGIDRRSVLTDPLAF